MPNFIIIPEKQTGFTGKSFFLSGSLHYKFNTKYEALPNIEHKLAELTFVVTNRNKYFIGIKYEPSLEVPTITMRGSCITTIKKYCVENNIPIVNDKRLAAKLYECNSGEYIPEECYKEIVKIIVWQSAAYNSRGEAYNLKGDYDRAIAELTKAIKLDPTLVNAYINRGCSYFLKDNYIQARADVNIALRIEPNNQDAQLLNEELRRKGF